MTRTSLSTISANQRSAQSPRTGAASSALGRRSSLPRRRWTAQPVTGGRRMRSALPLPGSTSRPSRQWTASRSTLTVSKSFNSVIPQLARKTPSFSYSSSRSMAILPRCRSILARARTTTSLASIGFPAAPHWRYSAKAVIRRRSHYSKRMQPLETRTSCSPSIAIPGSTSTTSSHSWSTRRDLSGLRAVRGSNTSISTTSTGSSFASSPMVSGKSSATVKRAQFVASMSATIYFTSWRLPNPPWSGIFIR